MKLRTRLALAFVLMSVVPLTVITFYSYNSSLKAFRRAVEAEETAIAADMGRRMEMVTAAASDRVDRISSAALAHDWHQRDSAREERFRQEVAATLGDTAALFSSLRFVPAVPAPPAPPQPRGRRPFSGAPRGERPNIVAPQRPGLGTPAPPPPPVAPPAAAAAPEGAPAAAPAPPVPPQGTAEDRASNRAAVDLVVPGLPADIAALAKLKGLPGVDPEVLKELPNIDIGTIVRQATRLPNPERYAAGMEAAARVIEQRAREMERRINRQGRLAEQAQWMARMKEGKPLDIPVRRNGQVVGTMNAQIDLDRVLLSVLSSRSPDSGEIAFAIDPHTHLHTRGQQDRARLESLGLLDKLKPAKEGVQTIRSDDWIVVARRDPSGVLFGIARPIGAALGEIRRATGRNLGLGMLAIVVALIGIAPLSRRMTRNISVLHAGVNQLAQGDLSARVPVRSKDEIGHLADAFNHMAEDLGAHQKLLAERERLRGELELCRQIQHEMLPKQPLRLPFAEIKGVSIPAREVGGDFFNYFLLPEGEVGLLVGDVSGKGVGAALLMANVQATLRARLPLHQDLAQMVDTIDREVEQNTPSSVYFTLFVGVLDSTQRTLRYVNAGHNPQYVLRAGGGLERLGSNGLPVGMFAGHGYQQTSVALAEGDLLFFYTDGITEVENETGEMFGSERLERLLTAHHLDGADAVLARIEQELAAFRGSAEPFDDATMMVLRLTDGAAKS